MSLMSEKGLSTNGTAAKVPPARVTVPEGQIVAVPSISYASIVVDWGPVDADCRSLGSWHVLVSASRTPGLRSQSLNDEFFFPCHRLLTTDIPFSSSERTHILELSHSALEHLSYFKSDRPIHGRSRLCYPAVSDTSAIVSYRVF